MITGWLTEDGAVEEISVVGDVNYFSDKWVAFFLLFYNLTEYKNYLIMLLKLIRLTQNIVKIIEHGVAILAAPYSIICE